MANTSAPQQALRPVAVGLGSGLVGGAQILCVQITGSLDLTILCGTPGSNTYEAPTCFATLPPTDHFQQATGLSKPP